MRSILLPLAWCLLAAAIVWHVMPSPAWPQESDGPMPYTCLSTKDADAIHAERGDIVLAWRDRGRFVEFLWRTRHGEFFITSFDKGTLRVCALKIVPYDPRESRSS